MVNEDITIVPSEWTVSDVYFWASTIGLPLTARRALEENEIDGSTLLTLSKADLREELLITSLPVRRYLWDAIERIRGLHEVSDYKVAVDLHDEEIDALVNSPPEDHEIDLQVVQALRADVIAQRRVIEDDRVARAIQGEGGAESLQVYQDAEVAADEQLQLDQLRLQEEYDHAYAQSLSHGRGSASRYQTNAAPNPRHNSDDVVRSLVSMCIDSCVSNRINVAEALQSGRVTVPRRSRVDSDEDGLGDDGGVKATDGPNECEDATETIQEAKLLPIPRCYACYERNVPGFELACSHTGCKRCMTQLMHSSMQDRSLLPLKCCGVPIDMYQLSRICLEKSEYDRFVYLVAEVEAVNKMYCPSCEMFINLDPIDADAVGEIECDCGADLCVVCRTASHPGISCAESKARLAGMDEEFLSLAKREKWQQCPGCDIVIELITGCNHMICANCSAEFCYQCRSPWNSSSGYCSSGTCERWEEENLLEDGEERVQAMERARGRAFGAAERVEVFGRALAALQANETCTHNWVRRNMRHGNCERCGFYLNCYGMVCTRDCSSTVCYVCAHHRIPASGWR